MLEEKRESSMRDTWTPGRGIVRGCVVGVVVAVILSGVLCVIAAVAPMLVVHGILRVVIGFGVAYLLFGGVHAAAGMVGWPCTVIVVVLSVLVLSSTHIVFAINGLPSSSGTAPMIGWAVWFHPITLFVGNIFGFLGITLCVYLSHDGVPGPDIMGFLVSQPLYGRTR